MTTNEAQWVTFCVIVAFVIFDLAMIWIFGPDASVSRVVAVLIAKYPLCFTWIVFGLGLLVGHVWLPAFER